MPKRMLSRKQCVFVIVVLPLLIVPAMFIINSADRRIDEVFIPPKRADGLVKSVSREVLIRRNLTGGKVYIYTFKNLYVQYLQ